MIDNSAHHTLWRIALYSQGKPKFPPANWGDSKENLQKTGYQAKPRVETRKHAYKRLGKRGRLGL
jgi:hypothetical protein